MRTHAEKQWRVRFVSDVMCSLVSSDLERSVEEMRTGAGLNHHLVSEQEIEQKSLELRRLGETVTDLKSECFDYYTN